jgi:hypothetical protein
MPISKNPKRKTAAKENERAIEALISQGGAPANVVEAAEEGGTLKPIMIRFPRHILGRIDLEAKRLGITRTAFIVQSTVRELDRAEGGQR